jgi:hypothetical protein
MGAVGPAKQCLQAEADQAWLYRGRTRASGGFLAK